MCVICHALFIVLDFTTLATFVYVTGLQVINYITQAATAGFHLNRSGSFGDETRTISKVRMGYNVKNMDFGNHQLRPEIEAIP
jgi:hypothetical protein